MKVKDLKIVLNNLKDDFEIYLSSDSEGNSYGTTDINMSIEVNCTDKYCIFFPYEEGLSYEDLGG